MRAEWAKAKARADRWHEEVLLLTEEMRRTISFLDWKGNWWADVACSRPDAPLPVEQGMAAYAAKQCAVYHSLAMSFAKQWHPVLKWKQIPIKWPSKYTPTDSTAMIIDP